MTATPTFLSAWGENSSWPCVGLKEKTKPNFKPRVILMQDNRCLRWIAKVPGFRSEHIFQLEDIGPNRTKYIHQERISGLLSRIFFTLYSQR